MCQVQNCCEVLTHPVGMLDRDQRTTLQLRCCKQNVRQKTKSRYCDHCPDFSSLKKNSLREISVHTPSIVHPKYCLRLQPISSSRHRRKFSGKVKDLYLFFIFLWISLSFFSQVTSKPIRIRRAMISNTKNPMCMHRIQKDDKDDSSSLVNFDQVQSLLKAFSVQVDLAFAEINHGILDYITHVFPNTDSIEDFHKIWSWKKLDWLHGANEMPKELLEPVPQDYQDKICSMDWTKADTLLTKLLIMEDKYHRLDMGLDKIIEHYKNNPTVRNQSNVITFITRLKDKTSKIKWSLSSLLESLNYDKATLEASNSNPMPKDYVNKETPDLEHWVILREIMNYLELCQVELKIILESLQRSEKISP